MNTVLVFVLATISTFLISCVIPLTVVQEGIIGIIFFFAICFLLPPIHKRS